MGELGQSADGAAELLPDHTDREAQPVDAEQPPRLPFAVVGIGGSAGGLEAFADFLESMRPDSGMAFVFILHLAPDRHSLVAEILSRHTAMPVAEVTDGVPVEPNRVYVIRPARVLTILDGRLHLGPQLDGPRAANRPVDDFFKSLAQEQRERGIAIIMSGMGSNGSAGAQAIKAVGGLCIAQDPESAQFPSMPRHLIDAGYADFISKPQEIPDVLLQYIQHPYATGDREADAETILRREHQHVREIMAVLRTRLRQDFSGYKKPTVLRRIQRRMGLARVTEISEYAKLLRQSPSEVSALSDDLLIHVTGFFRDSEAWEALRSRVIVPLVGGRENESSIRCWVTACSSGEEAYSLAILLVEESERTSKHLDIKVFATDMADRTLAHARNGIYPGGIEADISPERLGRFFEKGDATYRVRQDLRECVVFAPQNLLQDPPFSRLDIATCRNLLIYLEPSVQQRVLSLMHFGLREGGTLFLGNSESLGDSDELFKPLDKKARIFRRVGPTRHGMVDFPLPHALRQPIASKGGEPVQALERRPGHRLTFAQLTQRTLLEHHLPAAVLVDRENRILYFQGNTQPFLEQPSGEPTRDLMALARDGVRGTIRAALHRAVADRATVTAGDGWVETEPGHRSRLSVTVSPVADRAVGEFFVVSFDLKGVFPAGEEDASGPEIDPSSADDMRRMRDELQSTIEELQTSVEELKASHEEIVSINEELQSSNEELETSKEEMQSLNEELTTVNAQLRAKMEEHQATSNDLASLLASTDIAVLFLDTRFRIRRFTPPMCDLLDLIATDIGRPLSDLARKFSDPELAADAETVLTRLVPIEREISTNDGKRWFLRRVTPYRTTDNRIDGVVMTFVEITARIQAEAALRVSEEKYRTVFDSIDEAFCIIEMRYVDGRPVDYRFLEANPAHERHTGVKSVVGRTGSELTSGLDAFWVETFGRVAATGQPERFQRADPQLGRHYDVYALRTGAPEQRRVAVLFTDITARKRDEERQAFLLKLSDTLRPLSDPVAIEVAAIRVLGKHLGVNRALYGEAESDEDHILIHRDFTADGAASITGRQRLSSFGSHWVEGYRAGRTLATSDFRDIGGSQSAAFEAIGVRACVGVPVNKNGRFLSVLIVHSATPRQWTQLEISLVEATAERTWAAVEQAKAEADLRASEARLRAVAANLPNGAAFVVDTNLRYTLAEGQALASVGFTSAHFEGKTLAEALPPELVAEYEMSYRRGLAGERFRVEHTSHDRQYVTHGEPLRNDDGTVSGVLAVSYDITDLRRAEDRLRLATAAARMGIWTLDADTGMHTRDANLNRLLGLSANDTTQPFADFRDHIHPSDRDRVQAAFDLSLRHSQPLNVEFRIIRPDGEVRWLRDQGDVFGDAAARRRQMAGACVDVTERREVEQSLRETEERFRLVVEGARDFAMVLFDKTGRITAWNAGAERLLGYTEAEAIGQNAAIIFTPEDREDGAPDEEFAEAARNGHANDGRWHLRKDGSRFWGSGVLAALRRPDGSARGFVKVLRDESVRKQLEEAKEVALEAAELASQAKDEFLATLSHELRTPLSAILIWANLLTSSSDTAMLNDGLSVIRNSADAQKQLIEDLLDTSRITSGNLRLELKPTNLAGVVNSAMESVLQTAQAKGVAIVSHVAPGIGTVQVDPNRIKQVMWNLLTNAVKFTPAGGSVSIRLRRRDRIVELSVTDTGKGISADFLPHVFELFRQADSTTTRTHGGLGLGLAICKKLVEQHGGTITAASEGPDRGATFTIALPLPKQRRSRSPAAKPKAVAHDQSRELSGIHVLLVEDDAEMRKGLGQVLRQAGARVTLVDSAAAAVEAYTASRPDLLVSDIGMPDEDGYSLIQRIRGLEQHSTATAIPAVALTALVGPGDRRRSLTEGFDVHLGKPVEGKELLAALQGLLSR